MFLRASVDLCNNVLYNMVVHAKYFESDGGIQ